ncbi:DUF2373 domain-containing protein [archaeon]|nr:MAG: DUF2373 domain-containing protein [archaeon]
MVGENKMKRKSAVAEPLAEDRPLENAEEGQEEPGEVKEVKPKKPKLSSSVRNKRKSRRSKGLPSKPTPPTPKGRDFSSDLKDYLKAWKKRDISDSDWKFNKVLQVWAIAHCLNDKRIDDILLKRLIPYLQSVQGGARDRMIQMLEDAVQGKLQEEEDKTEDDNAVIDLTDEQIHEKHEVAKERASLILSVLKC